MKLEQSFYKRFFKLYVVLVFQNVVTLSVNLADNIMLGAYSEIALSGVTAVNQVQFVFQQLIMALGDGMVVLCSQYWGKRQTNSMKKIMAAAMQIGGIVAVGLFFIASFFPELIMHLFTEELMIVAEGMQYLNVIRFSYFFFSVTQLLLATLRTVEVVKIVFKLSIITFFVNCSINYMLIFGNFGAPELGVTGAAIGTLIARILECVIVIVFIKKRERYLKLHWSDYLHMDTKLTGDYLRITAPMMFVQGLWGANTALQTVILGHMDPATIAANSAAAVLFLLVKSGAVGAAAAASILVGQTVGIGNAELVKQYARRLQGMFVIIGLCSGVLLFFLRIPILRLYRFNDMTMQMANQFLIILSVVCVGMSYQMPTNNGIIRGGGNTMFVLKMDLISIWLIVMPLSFVLAFVVEASPAIVVCCLNADQIFKCIPAFLKVNYGSWVRKLTRD